MVFHKPLLSDTINKVSVSSTEAENKKGNHFLLFPGNYYVLVPVISAFSKFISIWILLP